MKVKMSLKIDIVVIDKTKEYVKKIYMSPILPDQQRFFLRVVPIDRTLLLSRESYPYWSNIAPIASTLPLLEEYSSFWSDGAPIVRNSLLLRHAMSNKGRYSQIRSWVLKLAAIFPK